MPSTRLEKARPRKSLSASILVSVGTLLLFATGCASTRLDPVSDDSFVPEVDEQDLWSRADAFDDRIQEAEVLDEDEELAAYLDGIARRLLVHMNASEVVVRVHVLPDPLLNAFAMPNGSIYLHSGIVARAENEDQLAVVLAHELSHYLDRHSLKEVRTARNRHHAAVAGSVFLVLLGVAVDPGTFAGHLDEIQTNGYSRALESEADLRAFEAVRLAGYDVSEASKIFEQMIEESEEIDQPYYHGSHPKLTVRVEAANDYLAEHVRPGVVSIGVEEDPQELERASESVASARPSEYDDAIADLLLRSAELSLARGYRSKARRSLARHIAVRPDSALGYRLLARFHKSRLSDPAHRDAAIDAYREIVRVQPEEADGHRELGLILRGTQGFHEEASVRLARYLELSGDVVDRPIIEAYLDALAAVAEEAP